MSSHTKSPSRRSILAGATGLAAVGCAADGQALTPRVPGTPTPDTGAPPADTGTRPAGRPDIIYIYTDQLRFDALRVAGNPVAVTPNLDALAAEAVRFSHCITNGPSCRAARTSMMTGLPVHLHGVDDNLILPDPGLQSHVRRIRDDAGYHTMVIGKTHLHDGHGHFDENLAELAAWGFADAIELQDPQGTHTESAYTDWLTASTPADEKDKAARWKAYVLGYTWDAPPPDTSPWELSTFDHLDSFCGRTTADYLRTRTDDQPLYLQVCFPGPHKPFDPTSEFLALVDPADPRMPLPVLAEPAPPVAPLVANYLGIKHETWDEASARDLRAHYYAKVALVDAAIGEVIAALKDSGRWEDAWVIVHSDHGELVADHQMTGKVLGYEGSIRVPLLVKPPGGVAGWVDSGLVDQLDVTATLLAIAGLDPTGYGDRDLTARVLGGPDGPTASQSKTVLYENLGTAGLRDDRYKLGWDLATGLPVELYDLETDPDEVDNRVYDPALADVLDRLVGELRALRPLAVDEHTR